MHHTTTLACHLLFIAAAIAGMVACRSDLASPDANSTSMESNLNALLAQTFERIPTTPPAGDMPDPNQPARVDLVDPGAQPRAVLQWTPKPGVFDATHEHHEDFLHQGRTIFSVTVRARLAVEVRVDGTGARADVSVVEYARETRGEAPPNFAAPSKLAGRRFSLPLSPSGTDHVAPPEIRDDAGVDGLARVFRAVQRWSVPVPTDPVGSGASWHMRYTGQEGAGDERAERFALAQWFPTANGGGHITQAALAMSTATTKAGPVRLQRRLASVSEVVPEMPFAIHEKYRNTTETVNAEGQVDASAFGSAGHGSWRIERRP